MRTAIDTNVISALWSKEESAPRIAAALGEAKNAGGLVISPAVYAELLAHPATNEDSVNSFLAETHVEVDFELPRPVWLEACRRFAKYAVRRRRSGGEGPRRLLPDFIVGAHALTEADRLMTLDPRRYSRDFPELTLV